MKKNYVWILLLLSTFLLGACSNETEKDPDGVKINLVKKEPNPSENSEVEKESNDPEVEEVDKKSDTKKVKKTKKMSDEQIKDIVIDNLDSMEEIVRADFDEMLMPIDENTFAADYTTKQMEGIVYGTKEKFENFVAADIIDEWVRDYLFSAYISYHREYLNSDDIQSRFEVLDQSEDSFEVSFISLENDGGISNIGGTQHLYYIKENGHWVIQDREFINPKQTPLNLTFEDLKEYYSQFNEGNSTFEAIDKIEIDGVKHLIYKVNDEYYARNTIDSMYNYEILESYK